ncbi:MAG: VacJ family lipoprotein [Dokdonella sp.]
MLSVRTTARLRVPIIAAVAIVLASCTIAPPRNDDPWEKFNRRMYRFNDVVDRAAIRPAAVTYRKVTGPNARRVISNFFANVRMPITIANDVLQGEFKDAFRNSGRFVINTTLGFAGFFDPASQMNLTGEETDFGITLAKWGVPEGPYLVLPLVGSSSVRDAWRMPVDSYFFDPMSMYSRKQSLRLDAEYWPSMLYLVTLRASAIDAENLLEGAYDPYVFYRDAYRQRRLYRIYDGSPPMEMMDQLQDIDDDEMEQMLQEQYELSEPQSKPTP